MSKQTAVQYLIQYMMNNQYFVGNDLADVFEQAKAMEKEQMIQCALCLHSVDMSKTGTDILIDEAEQYYNETYGGKNE